MRSVFRLPMLLIWLTVLWVALWGDLKLGNALAGLMVAVGVVAVARSTGVSGLERNYFHPLAAVHFAGYFLVQLVKSNLIVAWEIITPGSRINRAIIEVPMHTQSPGIITLVANSITLTPGTVTIEVSERRDNDGIAHRSLFVHVLQMGEFPEVRVEMLKLERLAIKAFGSAADLVAVDRALAAFSQIEEAGS